MVADAVQVEPVSNENSLLTGKLTGNFVKFRSALKILTAETRAIQRPPAKFPAQQNRELFRRNREFVRANREFEPAIETILKGVRLGILVRSGEIDC